MEIGVEEPKGLNLVHSTAVYLLLGKEHKISIRWNSRSQSWGLRSSAAARQTEEVMVLRRSDVEDVVSVQQLTVHLQARWSMRHLPSLTRSFLVPLKFQRWPGQQVPQAA